MKDKANEIRDFIKELCVGEKNAVKGKDLCEMFNIKKDSVLRNIVNGLRMEGHPICSSVNGYYYATSQDDILKTINHLERRTVGIINAINGLSKISI